MKAEGEEGPVGFKECTAVLDECGSDLGDVRFKSMLSKGPSMLSVIWSLAAEGNVIEADKGSWLEAGKGSSRKVDNATAVVCDERPASKEV